MPNLRLPTQVSETDILSLSTEELYIRAKEGEKRLSEQLGYKASEETFYKNMLKERLICSVEFFEGPDTELLIKNKGLLTNIKHILGASSNNIRITTLREGEKAKVFDFSPESGVLWTKADEAGEEYLIYLLKKDESPQEYHEYKVNNYRDILGPVGPNGFWIKNNGLYINASSGKEIEIPGVRGIKEIHSYGFSNDSFLFCKEIASSVISDVQKTTNETLTQEKIKNIEYLRRKDESIFIDRILEEPIILPSEHTGKKSNFVSYVEVSGKTIMTIRVQGGGMLLYQMGKGFITVEGLENAKSFYSVCHEGYNYYADIEGGKMFYKYVNGKFEKQTDIKEMDEILTGSGREPVVYKNFNGDEKYYLYDSEDNQLSFSLPNGTQVESIVSIPKNLPCQSDSPSNSAYAYEIEKGKFVAIYNGEVFQIDDTCIFDELRFNGTQESSGITEFISGSDIYEVKFYYHTDVLSKNGETFLNGTGVDLTQLLARDDVLEGRAKEEKSIYSIVSKNTID